MSNIDAIDRLIDFTNTVKPYHTKIVEILTNYTYEEPVSSSITDILLIIPEPCACDPNALYANVGWDTQPWGLYDWVVLDTVDERGNFMYGVVDDVGNIEWSFPTTPPDDPDPDDCCTTCDVWLDEDVGWDTQPWGLYATSSAGIMDSRGNLIYNTATAIDGNVLFDNPYAPPDIDTGDQ